MRETSVSNLAKYSLLVEPDGKRQTEALDFFCFATRAETEYQLQLSFHDALRCLGIDFFQLLRVDTDSSVRIVWSEPASFRSPPIISHGTDDASAPDAARDSAGQLLIWPDEYLKDVSERLCTSTDQWLAESYSTGMRSGATITLKHPDQSRDIFRLGAIKGTFLKTFPSDIGLCATITTFAARQLRTLEVRKFRNEDTCPSLSSRELEVLRWCKDGKSYPEIATILGISVKTIEYHMANAMRKFGVNQKICAIIAAVRQGMIEL